LDADFNVVKDKLAAKSAEFNKLKNQALNPPNQVELGNLRTECHTLRTTLSSVRAELQQLKKEKEGLTSSQAQECLKNAQQEKKIQELEQSVANLTRECDALKLNPQTQAQGMEIASLRQQINRLETEKHELKVSLNAQSASNAFNFTVRGKNRAMGRADVTAELRYARERFPSYKLGGPLKSSATSTPTETGAAQDTPGVGSSAGKQKPQKKSKPGTSYSPHVKRKRYPADSDTDTDDDSRHRRNRAKGKRRDPELSSDSEESSESSSESEDDFVESNI
ncbi:hypothetical protein F5880DRAFT_1619581, partial [Lentinula raphanica]